MPIDLNIMVTIISVGIAVLTFFIGRQTSAKSSGQEWGELVGDVKHIKGSVDGVKSDVQSVRNEIIEERKDRKESIKRLHEKWEDHEKRLSILENRK